MSADDHLSACPDAMGESPCTCNEPSTLKAELAAWRKATGKDDPEMLGFELGRAGIDTHLRVLNELHVRSNTRANDADQALATLKGIAVRLREYATHEGQCRYPADAASADCRPCSMR